MISRMKWFILLEDYHRPKAFILIYLVTTMYLYFSQSISLEMLLFRSFIYSIGIWVAHYVLFTICGGRLLRRDIKAPIIRFINDYNHNLGEDQVYKKIFVPDPKKLYSLVIDPNPYTVSVVADKYIEILQRIKDTEANQLIKVLHEIKVNADRVSSLAGEKQIM